MSLGVKMVSLSDVKKHKIDSFDSDVKGINQFNLTALTWCQNCQIDMF